MSRFNYFNLGYPDDKISLVDILQGHVFHLLAALLVTAWEALRLILMSYSANTDVASFGEDYQQLCPQK